MKKADVKNALVYLAFALAGLVVGLWAFDRVLMPVVIGSGKAYPIPNLVGLPAEEAQRRAEEKGFRFKVVKEEYSLVVPAGMVMSQIPKAQSFAKKGRTIRVVVSKGGMVVEVPDVVGFLRRQAQIKLEGAGLKVGEVVEVYCDSVGVGRVAATDPAAGETVAVGTSVKLTISKGPESGIVEVPNLVGMKSDDACATLAQLGLKCVKVLRRIPTIADGEVFKQNPPPGTRLYRGNSVKIMVNKLE